MSALNIALCDDIMGMIGEKVEHRRRNDKVISHLTQIHEELRDSWGDGPLGLTMLYPSLCDEGIWQEMRFCQFVDTPEWLKKVGKDTTWYGYDGRCVDVFE
jgi:hypothetical protein